SSLSLFCISNFTRNARRAMRASNLNVSKSKIASNIAVSVNHAQISQNKINQAGCSRGLSAACKNVDPDTNRDSATKSRTNIVLRRAIRSRMIARVTCTITKVARCAFPRDELFDTIDRDLPALTRLLLIDLTIHGIRSNHAKENSSEETGHPGTLTGAQFRLRAAAYHQRRSGQQGFRCAGK